MKYQTKKNIQYVLLGLQLAFDVVALLCALILYLYSKTDYNDYIRFINYTDRDQVVYVSPADTLALRPTSTADGILGTLQFLRGKSHKSLVTYAELDSVLFNANDGRVRFYFIDDSVYMHTPLYDIVRKKMYNRKITLAKHQLDSCSWTVEYRR